MNRTKSPVGLLLEREQNDILDLTLEPAANFLPAHNLAVSLY
jgi:hypothetical protein